MGLGGGVVCTYNIRHVRSASPLQIINRWGEKSASKTNEKAWRALVHLFTRKWYRRFTTYSAGWPAECRLVNAAQFSRENAACEINGPIICPRQKLQSSYFTRAPSPLLPTGYPFSIYSKRIRIFFTLESQFEVRAILGRLPSTVRTYLVANFRPKSRNGGRKYNRRLLIYRITPVKTQILAYGTGTGTLFVSQAKPGVSVEAKRLAIRYVYIRLVGYTYDTNFGALRRTKFIHIGLHRTAVLS